MEYITVEEPKNVTIPFKVSATKKREIKEFCEDREWNVGAFCRVAVEESMASVVAREKEAFTDEATGD